jgi:DNA transformation protein
MGLAASSTEYVAFVKEQLAAIRDLTSRRFFGGIGLHSDGLLFAMVMDGALYFAVDDHTRPRYLKMGSRCFSYMTKKGRVEVKKFQEVPGELLDEQDQLLALAIESIETVRRRKKPRRS